MFEQDEDRYREALLKVETTKDDRINLMRNRVNYLRQIRENDRKQLVQEKLDQQWR
jgi:hypothetical protein